MALIKMVFADVAGEVSARIARAAQIGLTDTRADWQHVTRRPRFQARTVHLGHGQDWPQVPRFGADPAEVEW